MRFQSASSSQGCPSFHFEGGNLMHFKKCLRRVKLCVSKFDGGKYPFTPTLSLVLVIYNLQLNAKKSKISCNVVKIKFYLAHANFASLSQKSHFTRTNKFWFASKQNPSLSLLDLLFARLLFWDCEGANMISMFSCVYFRKLTTWLFCL